MKDIHVILEPAHPHSPITNAVFEVPERTISLMNDTLSKGFLNSVMEGKLIE